MLGFIKRIGGLGLVSGLVCGAAAWLLAQIPMVNGLEEWLQDGRFFARGPRQTQTKIILILLDRDSLEGLPDKLLLFVSPQLAEVVTYLSDRKAAAIGLDFWIPQDQFGRKELQKGGKGDATKLGTAIADAGNVVLAEMKVANDWQKPLPQWRWKELLDPDPARIDLGFVNLTEDDDNVARRQLLGADGHTHFSLALFARSRQAEVVWADGGLTVGDRQVPLDAERKLRINFVGPPRTTFTSLSFWEVLAAARNQRAAPADFSGAIVIIARPTPGDLHTTPWANHYWRPASAGDDSQMPGSELHANIIATIGDDAFIHPVSWLPSLPLLLVIGGVLGIALEELNRARSSLWFLLGGPPLLFLFCLMWCYGCSEAFARSNLRFTMAPVFLTAILAYVGVLALQRIFPVKRRRSGAIKIFVSYRRDDSRHVAERIYGRLAARFGKENVFKDVDSIALGQDFRPALDKAVSECAAMLAIIGPRWLTIADGAGQRRLDNSADYVRLELEGALARSVPVIPVLVDGAAPLNALALPAGLQALAYRQATPVRPDPDFRNDMERLLTALGKAKPG